MSKINHKSQINHWKLFGNCKFGNWKLNLGILVAVFFVGVVLVAPLALAGTSYNLLQPLPTTGDNPDFGYYMEGLIRFLVLFSAVAAVVMITIGGVLYAFSEALETQKTARSMISDALLGLIIALLSYLILWTINPDLVNLKLTIPGLPKTSSGLIISPGGIVTGANGSPCPNGDSDCVSGYFCSKISKRCEAEGGANISQAPPGQPCTGLCTPGYFCSKISKRCEAEGKPLLPGATSPSAATQQPPITQPQSPKQPSPILPPTDACGGCTGNTFCSQISKKCEPNSKPLF